MLSKNKGAISGFQRLLISLENGTATFFKSDCQLFRVDNNLYARCQAHQIICIRQRIRFVEIIDTPGQPTLSVAPNPKTANMKILPILWGHHTGRRILPAKVEPTGKTSRGKR